MNIYPLFSQNMIQKSNPMKLRNNLSQTTNLKSNDNGDTFSFTGAVPVTESVNPNTIGLKSSTPTTDVVSIITKENERVAPAVEKENEKIAEAVDTIVDSFNKDGKLYYFGAGTSGRLGVLDASECPPTFSVDPKMVNGIIAGGDTAVTQAVEGAEDNFDAGKKDAKVLTENDVAVVISASGNPEYLMGVIEEAKKKGTKIVGVTCNPEAKIKDKVDTLICPVVGPEVIAGSSRLKAGTAQKMVLNTLTTAAMIKIGRFYQGNMIYVSTTNEKLHKRAARITSEITNQPIEETKKVLEQNNWQVPVACLILNYGLTPKEAKEALAKNKGNLEKAIDELENV